MLLRKNVLRFGTGEWGLKIQVCAALYEAFGLDSISPPCVLTAVSVQRLSLRRKPVGKESLGLRYSQVCNPPWLTAG